MDVNLLSDTEQEERAKPQLLPAEEELLAFLQLGSAPGNALNSIMPHRSIEEWSVWVDFIGNSKKKRQLPTRLKELDRVSEFIESRLAVIAREYPSWYPDAPVEKPPAPSELEKYPILTGMEFDIVRWYSLMPGQKLSSSELNAAIDDAMIRLCDGYPHMSMPYLEKMAKNRYDPHFYMKAREAAAFFEEYGYLYDEWLSKSFPEYYASGETNHYKFIEKRMLDANTWEKIDKIVKEGDTGKQVMLKLMDYLPAKLVHEAFYRSSGLSQPALKFLKTYGDVDSPISGIWTESHDYDLIDNDMTVIRKLHGPTNVALRKQFLASKVPEVTKLSESEVAALTVDLPEILKFSGPTDFPTPEATQAVLKRGGLDAEALAASKKALLSIPESDFADTIDFLEDI